MNYKEMTNLIKGAQTEIELEISRSGLSCLWEAGGSYTNTGSSQIICDRFGNPKKAIYVPARGDLCNGRHALIPVAVGDMIIETIQWRGDHEVFVWEIICIEGRKATLELVEYCKNKRANEESVYSDAVQAAMAKASAYHCREVYFAR